MSLDNKRKTVSVSVNHILSLIHCADDYGYDSDLVNDFAEMLEHKLTTEEIEVYAVEFKSDTAYGIEDYENAIETLTKFKEQYCHE